MAIVHPHVLRTTLVLVEQAESKKARALSNDPPTKASLRYASYRAVFAFLHGHTDPKKPCKPLPACCMKVIREKYSDHDNTYMGFRD